MWKIPVDGGEAVQVTDLPFFAQAFLPDGKLMFGNYFDEQVSPPRWRSALVTFENGQLAKAFDLPPKTGTWRMSDEKTLIYVHDTNDVSNIWTVSVDGGTPKQLTKFSSENIFAFAQLGRFQDLFALQSPIRPHVDFAQAIVWIVEEESTRSVVNSENHSGENEQAK